MCHNTSILSRGKEDLQTSVWIVPLHKKGFAEEGWEGSLLGTVVGTGSMAPTIMYPDASWLLLMIGAIWTGSYRHVRHKTSEVCIQNKSTRDCCNPWFKIKRLLPMSQSALCITIEKISPSTMSHFFMLVHFWVRGILSKKYLSYLA